MGFNILQVIKSTPSYVSPYKSLYVVRFQVDTESDLPAREQTDYIIDLGSTAHVVDTNSEYAIKSNGTWVLQYEGTAAYTKAEIDEMFEDVDDKFDDYQPLLTWDNVPTEDSTNPVYSKGIYYPLLTYINETFIDLPTKNRLQNTGVTATVGEVTFTVNDDGSITAVASSVPAQNRSFTFISSLPAGTWYYSTNQPLSGVSPAPCFSAINKSGAQIANDFNNQVIERDESTNYQFQFTIRNTAEVGTPYTFYPMICTPIEYAMSNKYIQYTANRSLNQQQLRTTIDDMTIPSEEVVEQNER